MDRKKKSKEKNIKKRLKLNDVPKIKTKTL